MALSADQRAALQLVLERGRGYAELAEMLDVSEAEVRDRARTALSELGGDDPDRNVVLTDYLLGQADPIDRADAIRHLREDPDDHRLATTVVERLRRDFPEAELPRLPGEPRGGRFLRRAPAERPDGDAGAPPATTGLTRRQSQLVVGLGAGAVLLVAIVLALTGAFGGDDAAEGPNGDEAPAGTEDLTLEAPGPVVLRGGVSLEDPGADPNRISVALEPVGDRDGTGEAVFGLTGEDQLFVEVDVRGLAPPGGERTYVLWLMLDREQGWPLAPLEVGGNGRFDDRLAIPANLLPILSQMESVTVELTRNDVLAELIQTAIPQAPGGEGGDGGGGAGGAGQGEGGGAGGGGQGEGGAGGGGTGGAGQGQGGAGNGG